MKDPYEVFADIYLERLRGRGHDVAVVEAFAATLFDLHGRGERDQEPLTRFKLVTDKWSAEGTGDASQLRERLRHDCTDWVLGKLR